MPEGKHISEQITALRGDFEHMIFHATAPNGGHGPQLAFDIALSAQFSRSGSIEVLYWAVNHEQTWITLQRSA